nr:thermostable hemolysin [Dechloromonas sp. A34]
MGVFTATGELIRIFAKLGLPLLALAPADPARLGSEAGAWGSYYETAPVVVAGRIRWAFERQELWT